VIDRWTPLRLLVVIALLFTPVWQWLSAARLPWLYLVALACALAFFATPLVRAFARAWGVLDVPHERKVHATATPLLGGAAVYGAFAVTVLTNFDFSRGLKGVAVGGTIVVAVGLLDDMTDLPAWLKLGGQIAAASAAIAYGVVLTTVPFWVPGFLWLNVILTVLWFLTVTNAIQFLDGMDGLAAGLGVIAGIFFSIVSLQSGQRYLMFLSAALVGACLGFLPYNFRPGGATVFLGDSGSSFIGFTLAGLAAMGVWADDNPVVSMLTPALIVGVPLFDIAFVGIVRVLTGKVHSLHEWLAYTGRDHMHHRLAALGLTKTQSVLLIFFIASTLGLSAILLKDATPHEAVLILVQAACILALVAVLEGVGRGRPRGREPEV
jgi:UDP-GlcNAc:undecaprenyl-phosphate GlcNAc-1-phosphate transferase